MEEDRLIAEQRLADAEAKTRNQILNTKFAAVCLYTQNLLRGPNIVATLTEASLLFDFRRGL